MFCQKAFLILRSLAVSFLYLLPFNTMVPKMFSFQAILGFLFLQSLAVAYPGYAPKAPSNTKRQAPSPVDVSGAHAFTPPSSSDLRGACPGLNAAANHNYIPHNGYMTIAQAVSGLHEAFGMGVDLANFFAVAAVVEAGDGFSFSIGGPPPRSLVTVGGLLGQPQGLSNSHNRFEGDASPTRGDLYEYGNDYLLQISQFRQLYDAPGNVANPTYTFDVLSDFSDVRMHESIANNPYYLRGPVGIFVPAGTHALIPRLFSNHTGSSPDAHLTRPILKSFFSITGGPDSSSLVYTPGHEQIPANWYKRPDGTEYGVANFAADLKTIFAAHPDSIAFGGNTGTTNSFTGLNVTDFSGGVYNAATLLQGNNLACFLFQTPVSLAPDLIRNAGVISDVVGAADKLAAAGAGPLKTLGCPQLATYDTTALAKFPGWTRST